MTTNVLLLHYNNYFNRQVKKLNTVSEYKNADSDYSVCNGINFVPGDGAFTTLTLGFGNNPSNIFDNGANFDYLVVMDADSTAPDYDIISRWFILEANRTRDGQYELSLKRDVVADCYESIITAPTYIEKAHINSTSNPLLFNKESLQVNQIKQDEYLLKDETKCGWVVGYVSSTATWPDGGTVSKKVAVTNTANITVDNLSDWAYWKNCVEKNTEAKYMSDLSGSRTVKFRIKSNFISNSGGSRPTYYNNYYTHVIEFNPKNTSDVSIVTKQSQQIVTTQPAPSWYTDWVNLTYGSVFSGNNSFGTSSMNTVVSPIRNSTYVQYLNEYADTNYFETASASDVSTLRALSGSVIYETNTNTYYQISIIDTTNSYNRGVLDGSNALNYFNSNITRQIRDALGVTIIGTVSGNLDSSSSVNKCTCYFTDTGYAIRLTPISVTLQVNMSDKDHRDHLKDAAYDMFCIPYSDDIHLTYDGTALTCSKFAALAMGTAICEALGSSNTYDLQLLPYCPNRALVSTLSSGNYLSLNGCSYNIIFQHVGGQVADLPVSAVIWCTESIFDLNISNPESAARYIKPYTTASSIAVNEYYLLTEMPTVPAEYNNVDSNYAGFRDYTMTIELYRVDKSTGMAEYETNLKKVAMFRNPSTGVSWLSLGKGTFSSSWGYKTLTKDEYNALSYFYMFRCVRDWTNVPESMHADFFLTYAKVPKKIYYVNPDSPEDLKVSNDCTLYRLVSGNYASAFEFSMAKSYGIDGYKVECTYKPFTPYIHVMPKLKGLYGENFTAIDDARGLVCGGDYSITQLSSAWATYQMNNKNYQEMFDRQIQNMDVNNAINMQEAKWSAVAGALTGGATGATAGAMSGAKAGPYGAIAGAIVGGVAGTGLSIAGGVMDVQNLAKRQNEAKDYAIDMYNYNLQNIKAIPSTLAKVSALTYNTRVWPFLEYYTCTETEEQAYRAKIEYDGMTVNAIGQIQEYITAGEPHYLRGAIIRLPDLKEDSQIAHEIYNEILKGVYI